MQGKEFTPYDLAVIKGYKEAAEYLKQKGALPNADVTNIKKSDSKEKKETPSSNDTNKKQTKDKEQKVPKKQEKNVKKPSPKPESGKTSPKTPDKEVVESDKAQTKDEEEKDSKDTDTAVTSKSKSVSPEATESPKPQSDEKEVEKNTDSPKPVKTVTVKPPVGVNIDADKLQKKLSKKPSADSVLEKEDGIRTSTVSLRSDSPSRNTSNYKKGNKVVNGATSPSSLMGQSQGKKKDTGKYVSLEKTQTQVSEEPRKTSAEDKQRARRASKRQKGQNADYVDDEDSGTETDRDSHSRAKHAFKVTSKPYLDQVQESVWRYQTRRNRSRRINQMKRAQIHTGPMHDIVMFSKMMDNYRKGIVGEEEETTIRNYANWDGYLNGKLTFLRFSNSQMEVLVK